MHGNKTENAFVAALFLASFGIRFLFLDETASSPLMAINTLRGTDMEGYLRWAVSLSLGRYEAAGAFWQAPLYPYFLSALFRIFGINIYMAALIQVFLSSATCILIYFLARECFCRRTAYAAGIIACFYGPLVFYSAFLLSETLGIFIALFSLLFLVKSLRNPEKPGFTAAGGALLGMSALARPNFALFAPFFLSAALHGIRGAGKKTAYAAFFVIPMALAILPVTVRNYAVSGEFVPVSANFYETFRLSNSYDSLVLNYTEPELPVMPLASSAFWSHQLRKAVYFWWGFEVPQNVNYYLSAEHSRILRLPLIPFWLLGPLGLAGIFFWSKSNHRRDKTLLFFFLTSYASIVVLYICSRFRLPAAAALIPFASYGAVKIFENLRTGNFRRALIVISLCAVLSIISFPWSHPRIRGADYMMLGFAAASEGMHEEAVSALEKSIPLLPPPGRKAAFKLLEDLRGREYR